MSDRYTRILLYVLIISDVAISGSQPPGPDGNPRHPPDKGQLVASTFDGTSTVTAEEADPTLNDYDYDIPISNVQEIKELLSSAKKSALTSLEIKSRRTTMGTTSTHSPPPEITTGPTYTSKPTSTSTIKGTLPSPGPILDGVTSRDARGVVDHGRIRSISIQPWTTGQHLPTKEASLITPDHSSTDRSHNSKMIRSDDLSSSRMPLDDKETRSTDYSSSRVLTDAIDHSSSTRAHDSKWTRFDDHSSSGRPPDGKGIRSTDFSVSRMPSVSTGEQSFDHSSPDRPPDAKRTQLADSSFYKITQSDTTFATEIMGSGAPSHPSPTRKRPLDDVSEPPIALTTAPDWPDTSTEGPQEGTTGDPPTDRHINAVTVDNDTSEGPVTFGPDRSTERPQEWSAWDPSTDRPIIAATVDNISEGPLTYGRHRSTEGHPKGTSWDNDASGVTLGPLTTASELEPREIYSEGPTDSFRDSRGSSRENDPDPFTTDTTESPRADGSSETEQPSKSTRTENPSIGSDEPYVSSEGPQMVSPRRVEFSESDLKVIRWDCPPDQIVRGPSTEVRFEWRRVSRRGEKSAVLNADPTTNRLHLENPGLDDEGRYVCITRKTSPLEPSEMFFFQLVILKTKWVDIGSIATMESYYNQRVILNCPHGDILMNGAPLNVSCPSRIIFLEQHPEKRQDSYSCSDSLNTTAKLPATASSSNCSLSLLGCGLFESDGTAINIDRCHDHPEETKNSLGVPRCPGQTLIRFYYDLEEEKCLPFETDICGFDYSSFQSLSDCERNCLVVREDIQTCFHPENQLDSSCTIGAPTIYKTTYSIISNKCEWFLTNQNCALSKNVFESERSCRRTCLDNKHIIQMELRKMCLYKGPLSEGSANEVERWVFLAKEDLCVRKNVSLTGKPFVMSFTTKEGCQMCQSLNSEAICESRPANGDCKRRELKWIFSSTKGGCVLIMDGGCGESLNRFNTQTDCEAMCSRFLQTTELTTTSTRVPRTTIASIWNTTEGTTKDEKIDINRKKRVNRGLGNHHTAPIKGPTTSTTMTEAPMALKVHERFLEKDPCFGEATYGVCKRGPKGENYTITKSTYVRSTGQCLQVQFTGCDGGENLFDNANDCESSCKSRLRYLKHKKCKCPYSDRCVGSESSLHLRRYHFVASEMRCLPFQVVNSEVCTRSYFKTEDECNKFCTPERPSEQLLRNRCFGSVGTNERSCREEQRVTRWFYMPSVRQCLEYRACPGASGGNRFPSRAACEDSCMARDMTKVCRMPSDEGEGNLTSTPYFYDDQEGRCRMFTYRGALGNWNRFLSKEDCVRACADDMLAIDFPASATVVHEALPQLEAQKAVSTEAAFDEPLTREHCLDPPKFGDCGRRSRPHKLIRFHFIASQGRCEAYPFSQCGPVSRNSFDSLALCDWTCAMRLAGNMSSACTQTSTRCPRSTRLSWKYEPRLATCAPIPSCGNRSAGHFSTEAACVRSCVPPPARLRDLFDVCHLPLGKDIGCPSPSLRWTFDPTTEVCTAAAACPAYGNNFPSEAVCLRSCAPASPQDICRLPPDRGPCTHANHTQYFFDWRTQRCATFSYGGCLGNRNRFPSWADCAVTCPSINKCNIRARKTRCKVSVENRLPMYAYVSAENRCARVNETVCGNSIKFHATLEACERVCVLPADFGATAFNVRAKKVEAVRPRCRGGLRFNTHPICTTLQEWLPRFFYDHDKKECAFFYYNGCDGIADRGNRFLTLTMCRKNCSKEEQRDTTSRTSITSTTATTPNHTAGVAVKRGLCPEPHNPCSRFAFHTRICYNDSDCGLDKKCCTCESDHSLVAQCMAPVGCRVSRYGCCSDGDLTATDPLHLTCPRTPLRSVNIPETMMVKESQYQFQLRCLFSGDPRPNITWTHLPTQRRIEVEPVPDLVDPFWSGDLQYGHSDLTLRGLWVCRGANEIGEDDIEVLVSSPTNSTTSTLQILDEGGFNFTVKYAAFSSRICLHCPIYGVPRPSVRWFFKDSFVASDSVHVLHGRRFLCLRDIQFAHGGIWRCDAAQSTRLMSYFVELKVLEPLRILPYPGGTTIKARMGQRVVLYCNVPGRLPPQTTWSLLKDGTETVLKNSGKKGARMFHIGRFNYSGRAQIRCTVHNKVSEDRVTFEIILASPGDIVVEPAGFHFVGDTVTLRCPDQPKEDTLQVLWKKDLVPLRAQGLGMRLQLQSPSDSGHYTCQHGGRTHHTYVHVHATLPD